MTRLLADTLCLRAGWEGLATALAHADIDSPGEGEDMVVMVQGDVGEQVCVISAFWLEDVHTAGGANQTGGEHGIKADVTANVDECVTRL